ncbi:MAG: hypothetical protein WCV63_02755 [Negativicutes bacterium]
MPFYTEYIGYAASLAMLISLIMKSMYKFRIINTISCMLFVAYGLLLGATAIVVANIILIIVNLYFVIRNSKPRNDFIIARCGKNDSLLNEFVNFHLADIKKLVPQLNWDKVADDALCYYLMLNMQLAGVWVAEKIDAAAYVVKLDYVAAEYRDMEGGKFIYRNNYEMLRALGIRTLITNVGLDAYNHYVEKMGFVREDQVYKLVV